MIVAGLFIVGALHLFIISVILDYMECMHLHLDARPRIESFTVSPYFCHVFPTRTPLPETSWHGILCGRLRTFLLAQGACVQRGSPLPPVPPFTVPHGPPGPFLVSGP